MLRRVTLLTVTATLAAAVGLMTAAAPVKAATVCSNTTISNASIPGGISVPPGASCILNNVAVSGDVVVTNAKQFLATNLRVSGSININGITDPALDSSLCGTKVTGNVTVQNTAPGV